MSETERMGKWAERRKARLMPSLESMESGRMVVKENGQDITKQTIEQYREWMDELDAFIAEWKAEGSHDT